MASATACSACAKAKRKCGRQVPHCLRCQKRKVTCHYPPPKPCDFVLLNQDDAESDIAFDSTLSIIPSTKTSPQSGPISAKSADDGGVRSNPNDEDLVVGFPLPVSQQLEASIHYQIVSSWFSSTDTWESKQPPPLASSTFDAQDVKRTLEPVRQWLRQWIDQGSNPFIHARLYRSRFPRPIQDAYMILSCYTHKTTSNEATIFRLMEDRVKLLVVEQSKLADSHLDPLEHLARVQALLLYQIVGLYDGDIRLRHLAEKNIPVLNRWMHQMVQHAGKRECLGEAVISSPPATPIDRAAFEENRLWYSWILAESIRRTWVLTSGVQGLYLYLQQGPEARCLGGMMFTTRRGAWDAASAPAWEKLCAEINVGLLQTASLDQLFAEALPDDVDEFAKFVLEVAFGAVKTERWRMGRV